MDRGTGVVSVRYTDGIDRDELEASIRNLPQYVASVSPVIKW